MLSPDGLTPDFLDQVRAARPRALGRCLTLVENGVPGVRDLMAALAPDTGHAWTIGLTGSPGVGKSTTVSALVQAFRARERRVAVLSVDPSSPFSGGAILGDRIRLSEHTLDEGVYIRSLASRGHLGGLSETTPQAQRVVAAAGFDVILVETVGVGQSEVEVAALADTTVVVLAPGMGDNIQAAKAGILEIGDVFVVNKADRDGASATVRDIRQMISLGPPRGPGEWRPPVVSTVAHRREGLDDFVEALDKHRGWLERTGELERRRTARAVGEVEAIALSLLRSRMHGLRNGDGLQRAARAVVEGRLDPFAAAEQVLAGIEGQDQPR